MRVYVYVRVGQRFPPPHTHVVSASCRSAEVTVFLANQATWQSLHIFFLNSSLRHLDPQAKIMTHNSFFFFFFFFPECHLGFFCLFS